MVRIPIRKLLLIGLGIFLASITFAQRGKDGNKTISTANVIANEFTVLSSNANLGDVSLQVALSSLNSNSRFVNPLSAGDLIYIYQAKGATVNGYLMGVFGYPLDSTQGQIQNYGNAGNYELAEVVNVPDATTINIACPLKHAYTTGVGLTQVIRVPRYSLLTINSGGVLTTQAFNGSTGGVLAIEVNGNTVINSGGSIDGTGLGFRGGAKINANPTVSANNAGSISLQYGADKGEGIAGYQYEYDAISGRYGKAGMANGGGGGCSVNAGGGGGANGGNPSITLYNGRGVPDLSGSYSTAWALENAWVPLTTSPGGGRGGYRWANSTNDPLLVGPGNVAWGGDKRSNEGGFGGRPVDYSTGRLFLGGGGGAGQGDDNYSGAGGNGGGLIYLICNGSISGSGQVVSNGTPGGNASGTANINKYVGIDGAGGGGAGGTIILDVIGGTITGISAIANAGNGGSQILSKGLLAGGPIEAEGPGGGGGGGYIAISTGTITQQVNGGTNGTTNSSLMVKFPPNGATKGDSGTSHQIIPTFDFAVRDTVVCESSSVTLSTTLAGTIPTGTTLTWYDAEFAGNVLAAGNTYTTPLLTSNTTYYVGACPGFYRKAVKVSISGAFSCVLTPTNASCTSGGSITTTLTGGTAAFAYSWNNGATSASLTNIAAGNYTVTVTDAGSCITTSITSIAAASTVDLTNIASTNLTCFGQPTGSIIVNPTGGQAPYSYSWSASGLSGATASNILAGQYTVTVADAGGCTSVSMVTITQPTNINTPTFTINNASCGASNGSAIAAASGGTGALSYSWSNAATGQSISGLPASSYNITVTDANACTKTGIAVIGNTGGATIVASVLTNVSCNSANIGGPGSANNGSASIAVSGGAPNYTYSWSNGVTGVTAVTGLTAGTYVVSVTDATGCTAVTSIIITEPFAISLTLAESDASCGASNGSVTAVGSGGAGSFIYSWDNNATGQTNSGLTVGLYTLTVTDANTCTKTVVATISNTNGGTVTTSQQTDVKCTGGNDGSVIANAIGGSGPYTYSWSNGSTSVTNSGSSQISNLVANIYSVTVVDAAGCSSVSTITISNPTAITTPTFIISNANCGQSDGSAIASTTGGTGILSYSWNTGANGQTVTNLSATIYSLTVTDGNGCTKTASTSIANTGGLSASNSVTTNIACNGGTGGVTTTTVGGSGPYTYSWSTGASFVTNSFTSQISNLTANNYSVTVTDLNGCSTALVITLTEPNTLTAHTNATDETCGNANGSIIAIASGGTPTYTYTWSNGALSTTNNTTSTAFNLTSTTFSVSIIDANGCTAITSATVNNTNSLNIIVTPTEETIAAGNSVAIVASGANTYTWLPSAGLSCTACSNPTATPGTTTIYTVIATDVNGCSATSKVTITVNLPCLGNETDIFIANVFSPNNDGVNDVLYLEGNSLTNIYWAIYNRWGNKIFETNEKGNGWDGTYNGKKMDDGIYLYYLKASCSTTNTGVTLKGNVSIVR